MGAIQNCCAATADLDCEVVGVLESARSARSPSARSGKGGVPKERAALSLQYKIFKAMKSTSDMKAKFTFIK